MAVPFMVPKEKVLAMSGRDLFPISQGRFYGRDGRVTVQFERNAVPLEEVKYRDDPPGDLLVRKKRHVPQRQTLRGLQKSISVREGHLTFLQVLRSV